MTHRRKRPSPPRAVLLPGDNEIARQMRELGWSKTDLGPVDVLESMTDGFVALDRDWRITYVNAAAERTNGVTREQLLGKTHWEAFPSALGTEFEGALRRAMAQRVPIRGESFYEPYGRWFEMDIHPLRNGGLAVYGRDITERKEVEEAQQRLQRERDELLASLYLQFERMPIACIAFDVQSRIIEWNPAAEAIFGHRREDVLGSEGPLILLPPAMRSPPGLSVGDMTAHSVNENLTKDGRTIICEWYNTPLCDAEGQVIGLLSMAQDVTERQQAELRLRENQERLAADLAGMARLQEVSTKLVQAKDSVSLLDEILEAAIAITSADMGNIQLRERGTEELKIVASKGLGRPFLDHFNTVQHGQGSCCGIAMKAGERVVIEDVEESPVFVGSKSLDALREAGIRAVQSTPLVSRSGQLVGMLSTHYRTVRRPVPRDLGVLDLLARQAADWIERTQSEEALRQSEERFRALAEDTSLLVWTCTPDKQCDYVNPQFSRYTGFPPASFLGAWRDDVIHPDDHSGTFAMERAMRDGVPVEVELRMRRHDGAWRWFQVGAAPIRDADGRVIKWVGANTDIDDSKRANEALRKSEERYRSLISQVRDFAIFSTDNRGVVTTWNEGCHDVLGYEEEEFVGLDSAELFTPEDRADAIPTLERRQSVDSGTARIDRWMVARGGRRFFAMGATAALKDPAGRLIGFSTVMRDLTQMKVTQDELAHHGEALEKLVTERTDELEKTTERLRLSERMASLGTLAAGLGHDMGNLLLPLDIRLDLLLQADLPRDLHQHVLGIQKCARYLQRLSSGLRLLAIDPLTSSTRETTELGTWWNDVGMILKDVLPGEVRLDHSLPPHQCWVAMGRTGLTQAVFNVVQNSADVLKERGYGLVTIAVDDDPNAPDVSIRITDDGPGMTEEVARHCMEPYFSTKARGESTGMGLAFVHGLVTGIGGRVEIDGGLGRGTSLSLMLPRAPLERRAEATASGARVKRSRVRASTPRSAQ